MTRTARLAAALIAVLAWITLVLHVQVGRGLYPDLTLLQELWRTGRYFTILTNLMLALGASFVALGGAVTATACAALTLWMAIVGIVFHTLLGLDVSGLRWWTNQSLHTALPIAIVAWWLAFAPKAGLRWRDAAYWLGWPALYLAYALIRGELDGRHPYFFVDPPKIGWPMVMVWVAVLTTFFWLAGLGMVALARRISRTPPDPANVALDGLRPQSPTGQDQSPSDA